MRITFLAFLLAAPLFAGPAVRYELSFPNAAHHEAEIQATFSGLGGTPLEVVMSRSSPGRYALHEFAKNVSNFRASDGDGHPLTVEHPTPYSWLVAAHGGTVVCSYTLYGDHVDGTYAAIDLTHAHLNLPATLVWARGLENAPATLKFNVPPGSGWKPATQLMPNEDGSFSSANKAESNLEFMMDSSVELSASPLPEWKTDDATFRLALHHQGSEADESAFLEMCKTVVAEERGVYGAFPKYDHGNYTFLVDFLPYADGDGMEHRDSTVISGKLNLHEQSHSAIGIVSHEFFHSWNVKRIRPKSLEPFDFERADMSGELWFAEGFTNYYGILVLRRAGISTLDEFAHSMGSAVNAVVNDPGNKVLSAVGMSEQAPFVDAARSIDATNTANNFISYYTYGQALAFGLDLAIRAHYPGKSLDDWMRAMWHEHPDVNRPYTLADLERTLAQVTDKAFAHEVFSEHISGLKPLDYQSLVAPAGLTLSLAHPGQAWLGFTRMNSSDNGVELTGPTLRGSPLYNAGIDSGDFIQACGPEAVKNLGTLNNCFAKSKPGETVTFHVKGRSGARDVAVVLTQDPALRLATFEQAGQAVTPETAAFRESWLSSKAGGKKP